MARVNGLHHITAIAGPAQENLDFYAGVLGMRLVKKSVNQDDPGTYHFFFADAEGHPGSDLTFFPWTHLAPPILGHGLATEVSLEVPGGSLEFWGRRLERYGTSCDPIEQRFGERVLPLTDPHGLRVALVESPGPPRRAFTPWEHAGVEAAYQVRGLHGARLCERAAAPTAACLTGVLGLTVLAAEHGWTRYGVRDGRGPAGSLSAPGVPDVPGIVDVRETPDARRGVWGAGAVHHLAFRVDDAAHQLDVRSRIEASGLRATPVIDRFWFKSVYFKEPGGVLFELATDGPGFGVDEDPAHLGESLVLPPWLEPRRADIEAALPVVALPAAPRLA